MLVTSTGSEDIARRIQLRREIRRAALVGMEFLDQRPVRRDDRFAGRARLKAKDLISLLKRHYARLTGMTLAAVAPGVQVRLDCFTPAGKPAVQIRFEQR